MADIDIAKKIAKRLLKKFNDECADKEQDSFTLHYLGNLYRITDSKGEHRVFDYHLGVSNGISMPYTEDVYAIRDMAEAVYREFKSLVVKKLKKGMLMIPKYKTLQHRFRRYGWWDSCDVEVFSHATFIKPCKEFAKVNKKLSALGLNEIDPMKWCCCYVSGKRSSYSVTDCNYYCSSSKKCNEVLAFLSGKKKARVEYVRHDYMGDMDYGIRYETEWSGSYVNALKITTSSGTKEL